VLWTYTPVTLGLESRARTTVYHCVDLLGAYPGVDASAVDRGEKALARAGALAVGSSEAVASHLRQQGFAEVLHWPNVADTALFETAARPAAEREPGLVVLAGNLSPHKIDCRMLQELLDAASTSLGAPRLDLVLVGPVAEGGGSRWAGLDALVASGARLAGTLSSPALADLLGRASVGVIPYATTPYTSGVDPLKRYEYLAAGLPVVTSGLACVDPVADAIWCTDSPTTFAARTLALLDGPSDGAIAARQDLARDHSWRGRGQEVRDLLGLELPITSELERQLP
jgi:glycosyltransferase involved in cell wall biosynthesis